MAELEMSPELREALACAKALHRQARESAQRFAQLRDDPDLDPDEAREMISRLSHDLRRQAYAAAHRMTSIHRVTSIRARPLEAQHGRKHRNEAA